MILETILSTVDAKGETHFAPIGVIFPDSPDDLANTKEIKLRLYAGSRTYENLRAWGEGVVNLTGNILYFADASLIKRCQAHMSAKVKPHRLGDADVVWEFSVTSFETAKEPALVTATVLCYDKLGGFSGFCRAHGAVLEAAVAVSRRHILPYKTIENSWPMWQNIVAKTGGAREKKAFDILTKTLLHEGFLSLFNERSNG